MIKLRWRQIDLLPVRFIGPSVALPALAVPGIGPVAAVIGPPGQPGPPGGPGVPGDGATDPGDLTLIFNNQLI